jgi:hypothetical protein
MSLVLAASHTALSFARICDSNAGEMLLVSGAFDSEGIRLVLSCAIRLTAVAKHKIS